MRKKLGGLFATLCCAILLFGSSALASTATFSGTMNYRLIDGSSNEKYYNIDANTNVSLSGKVTVMRYDPDEAEADIYGHQVGMQSTYIHLYEGRSSGRGVSVCSASVKVSSGSKSFSASGKTSKDGDKYLYIYKGVDDGYDVSVSGTISY